MISSLLLMVANIVRKEECGERTSYKIEIWKEVVQGARMIINVRLDAESYWIRMAVMSCFSLLFSPTHRGISPLYSHYRSMPLMSFRVLLPCVFIR